MYTYYLKRMNKNMFTLAIAVGFVLSLMQVYSQFPNTIKNKFFDSPYTMWLSTDSFHFSPVLFFVLLPLLASIPSSSLLREDINSGFLVQVMLHKPKKTILRGYILTAFLSGVILTFLLLVTNFLLYFLLLSATIPDNLLNSNISVIEKNTLFVGLYYTHPFIHAFLSICFASVFAGLFASFSAVNSLFLRNKYAVLSSAFCLQLFLLVANTLIKLPGGVSMVPVDFLRETTSANLSLGVSLVVTLLLALYTTYFSFEVKRLVW
ncbi:hypothetical protein IGI37_003573 [Enterococcus sp. AZ194]|uniref:hypothetical protein n=1 Tax=Enterococcus sp. AZ194 TaxID=2774629 RepID=UPI003F209D23